MSKFYIEAVENTTITLSKVGSPSAGTCTYGINTETTSTSYTYGDLINLTAGQKCYFSITEPTGNFNTSKHLKFTSTGNIKAGGNISSLNGNSTSFSYDGTCCGLFDHCAKLINIDNLILDIVTSNYRANWYEEMFNYCTGLTSIPNTLLPATTLEYDCYSHMFAYCENLILIPGDLLPATDLQVRCYSYMFFGCTSLKISETQTGDYKIPFRIPTSGTGTSAMDALSQMFGYTGGTFTGTPDINTTYYLWQYSSIIFNNINIEGITFNETPINKVIFNGVPIWTEKELVTDVTISGIYEVGNTISSSITPNDATVTYQWYRDDTPIDEAINSTYTLVDADWGSTIKLIVNGIVNYRGTVTSNISDIIIKAVTEEFGSQYNTVRGYGRDPENDWWVKQFDGYYELQEKGKVESVTFGSENMTIAGSGQGQKVFSPNRFNKYPCILYGSNDEGNYPNKNWTVIQSGIVMGTTTTITTSSKYKYLKVEATGPNYSVYVEGAGNYWACAIPTFTVNYKY